LGQAVAANVCVFPRLHGRARRASAMGNSEGAEAPDVQRMWREFDSNGSGFLDRQELEQLLQMVWQHYKINKPLSRNFIDGITEELDINKDGNIAQEEFEALFEELWEERARLFASQDRRAAPKAAAGFGGIPPAPDLPPPLGIGESAHFQSPLPPGPGSSLRQAVQPSREAVSDVAPATQVNASSRTLQGNTLPPGPRFSLHQAVQPSREAVSDVAPATQVNASPRTLQSNTPRTMGGPATNANEEALCMAGQGRTLSSGAATSSDTMGWMHCPNCGFEIDSGDLQNLKVEISTIEDQLKALKARDHEAPIASVPLRPFGMPPGSITRGRVPASFFQGPGGYWPQEPDEQALGGQPAARQSGSKPTGQRPRPQAPSAFMP